VSNNDRNIVLQAEGLCKSFSVVGEKLKVLEGIDLKLEKSSSLSIRGDSGCGKTTLLNLLARLEPADSGLLHWGAKIINAQDKPCSKEANWRAKYIGVVYQSFYIIPELKVLENVMMSVRLSKLSLTKYKDRALQLLEEMGVGNKCQQIPTKLSGGERQRVAIARALVNQPEVILADEPTGNLDERTGGEVMDLLLNTCSKEGTSLILVTHNPNYARATEQSSFLKDGRLIYE
jgi:ABC-type lipoprotein export system ATPase subunit